MPKEHGSGTTRDEVRPWAVVSAVPHEAGIHLIHPGHRARLIRLNGEDAVLVWAVFRECDGYQSVRQVVAKVHARFPDHDPIMIGEVVADLLEEGVLVDSREAFAVFHRLTENPQPFGQVMSAAEVRAYTRSPRLPVLDGVESYAIGQLPTALAGLQSRRRSCRRFADQPLDLSALGHILVSGYRIRGRDEESRATASGGALYPLKIFVINTRAGQDLPVGYYEYDPQQPDRANPSEGAPGRRLVRADARLDEVEIGFAFDADPVVLPHGAPVAVVIAADMMRHPAKYANRGHAYTEIEVGLALQNMELAAAEVGVASLPFGGFRAQPLAAELGMDKVSGSRPGQVRPLVTIAFGYEGEQAAFDASALADRLEPRLVGYGKPIIRVGSRTSVLDGAWVTATAPTRQAVNRRRIWVNSGKARSTGLARLRALAEGFERHASGVARVDREASVAELSQLRVSWVDPRQVAPLSEQQYARMPGLQPFSTTDILQWVAGRRAGSGESILVPVDLAFYPPPTSRHGRKPLSIASSNGVAAYTDEAGAVERALLELLERDALIRNWFHRDRPPRIPSELLPYHWQRRVEYWQAHNRDVHILDLSEQAHGAVVIEVAITSNDGAQPAFMSGAAASLVSFEDALQKAFMEAEAFIETIIRRPFKRRIRVENVRRVLHHAQLYSFPEHAATLTWLFAGEQASTPPQPQTNIGRLLTELDPVVVRLAPLGQSINTIVETLSPAARSLIADSPLWVVRVLSERLIPIHFGYGTGHHTHPTLNGRVAPESIWRPQYFA